MNPRSELLKLIDELHEANQELSQAALPLNALDELNLEQRQQMRERIQAGLERWGSISERIHECLKHEDA